jgi:hypothetical protein
MEVLITYRWAAGCISQLRYPVDQWNRGEFQRHQTGRSLGAPYVVNGRFTSFSFVARGCSTGAAKLEDAH